MNRARTDLIVIHCSATRPVQDIGAAEIRSWHLARGYRDIGYHLVIRRDGRIETGRALDAVGAHALGSNTTSVGVCMVGGLMPDGTPADLTHPLEFDAFTEQQLAAAHATVSFLRRIYPAAAVVGHRDLSPDLDGDGAVERHEWLKTCPGFDVAKEFTP